MTSPPNEPEWERGTAPERTSVAPLWRAVHRAKMMKAGKARRSHRLPCTPLLRAPTPGRFLDRWSLRRSSQSDFPIARGCEQVRDGHSRPVCDAEEGTQGQVQIPVFNPLQVPLRELEHLFGEPVLSETPFLAQLGDASANISHESEQPL